MPNLSCPTTAWMTCRSELRQVIPQAHYARFYEPTEGRAWEGDALQVAAPSAYAVSWLELPLHQQLADETLTRLVSREVEVRYICLLEPEPAAAVITPAAIPEAAAVRLEMPETPQAAFEGWPRDGAGQLLCPKHGAVLWRCAWPVAQRLKVEVHFCPSQDEGLYCTLSLSPELGIIRDTEDRREAIKPAQLLKLTANHRRKQARV